MPKHRFVRLAIAALIASTATAVPAQDFYRDPALWLDDAAQPLHLESLRGHYSVLTLAYGACRRICSTSLRILERVQSLADRDGVAVDFVVIGLDPVADRPADWAAFRQQQGLQRPNWHFLTGDAAATQAMLQRLGVRAWRVDAHLLHDFKIVLLSPQGRVLRSMETFDQPPALLLPAGAALR
jgi:cytochrome oxidase Cu insertion factor (SCO1/SenC/PrrC family)